ncbi:MAG TPA: hypothetical protein PLW86_19840, partial [Rhodocyclaceae bacterium]|nr:hypothetical protein [Rhodocyclaceae bacterium]
MPGNLYWKHLSAGLHLAGANGATSFPDVKGHTFTRTGNVVISTAQSRFAAEGSAYFPGGTSDLLKCAAHADFGGATDSLSIAFSMYPLALPVAQDIRLIMVGTNGSTGSFFVAITPSATIYFGIAASGTTSTATSAGAFLLNEWTDVLFTMTKQKAYICVNRAIYGGQTNQYAPDGSFPKRVQIGGDDSGFASVDGRFIGYLSEVQIQMANGRMPDANPPAGPFLETLELGLARAGTPPLALIRQTPPAHRILRQSTPALLLDTDNGGRGRVIGTTKNVGTPNYPVARRVRLL